MCALCVLSTLCILHTIGFRLSGGEVIWIPTCVIYTMKTLHVLCNHCALLLSIMLSRTRLKHYLSSEMVGTFESQPLLYDAFELFYSGVVNALKHFCAPCFKNYTQYNLQELQEFRTKTTISVISDLLKSMGKIFQGFFPWNICKYLRHLSIHLENYYIVWRVCVVGFLGGLSLHLNHLIASGVGICYQQFGTLPIGIFLSNLNSRQLETSLMTSYGHFWHMSTFGDSRAVWVLLPKYRALRKSKFSRWRSDR